MWMMGPAFFAATALAAGVVNTFAEWCVLLLRGDGTEASTTFTDESLVARTVTAVGNAQLDTSRFRFGTGAIEFDGTGDYATAPDSADFDFVAGDFTIEAWVYLNNLTVLHGVVSKRATSAAYAPFNLYIDQTTGKVGFTSSFNGSSWGVSTLSTLTLTASSWNHIAVTRSGNSWRVFVNGALDSTTVQAGTVMTNATAVSIGANAADGSNSMNGYIDNLRILKGVAAYTAAFTPSARALPYPDDTHYGKVVLLLRGEGADASTTFTDESWRANAVTANGNAQIDTAQFKFGSASMLFDGTDDYLSLTANSDFDFGTGDFTIECWLRPNSLAAINTVLSKFTTWTSNVDFHLRVNTSGTVQFLAGDSIPINITSTATIGTGAWSHVAVSRSSGVTRMFIGGAVQSSTHTGSVSIPNDQTSLRIGTASDGSEDYNGWIDNLRVTKGYARYTAAFTPPVVSLPVQAPPEPDPYFHLVKLQLNCNGADASTTFTDTSPIANTVTAFGNAQVDTAQSRFGGASALFDGAGDYLSVPNSADWDFGSGAFTVEAWVRFGALSGDKIIACNYQNSTTGWVLYAFGTSLRFNATGDSADITGATTLVTGRWYHVAVSGASGSIKLFLDGVQEGSTYTGSTSLDSTSALLIGQIASTSYFNGHIDDLRITKGAARYSADFTPPMREFGVVQGDAYPDDVVLLVKGDGPDAAIIGKDYSKYNRAITVAGNAQLDTAQSKFGGSSWLFDGTGDYLWTPDSADFAFGTGDFTIEGWFRFNALPTGGGEMYLCGQYDTAVGAGSNSAHIYLDSTGSVNLGARAYNSTTPFVNIIGTTVIAVATWYHIALVRSGSNFYLFLDGVLEASTTSATAVNDSAYRFSVGALGDYTGGQMNGWIDDFRVTKGRARHTSAFTALTKPFPEY